MTWRIPEQQAWAPSLWWHWEVPWDVQSLPPVLWKQSGGVLLGRGVDRAFVKGTAEVQPAFLFAWDVANFHSPVTQKSKANKGIFRWCLHAFSFVFPCRERQPLNLGWGWGGEPGTSSWREEAYVRWEAQSPVKLNWGAVDLCPAQGSQLLSRECKMTFRDSPASLTIGSLTETVTDLENLGTGGTWVIHSDIPWTPSEMETSLSSQGNPFCLCTVPA